MGRGRGRVYLFSQIRWSRWTSMPGALLLVGGGMPALYGAATSSRARSVPRVSRTTPWEAAEKSREALEAIAAANRTREDYTRAMDRFRTLYHATPGDVHAAASVYAVAELLAEQGRSLHDAKSLKAALGQY